MSKKGKKANRQGLRVLKGEGKRFSFSSIKQAIVFYILLLLALVVLVQLGYHWVGEQFLAWRLKVIEAEPGVMVQEVSVEGTVTRIEEVIESPVNGMVLHLAEPGERISIGTELATIGVLTPAEMSLLEGSEDEEPDQELWDLLLSYWQNIFPSEYENILEGDEADEESDPEGPYTGPHEVYFEKPPDSAFRELVVLYNEQPGFLSYFIDGFEDAADAFFEEGAGNDPESTEGAYTMEGQLVTAGQPIIKLVNNWQWYYHLTLPLHPGSALVELNHVDIEFDFAAGETIRAELYFSEIDEDNREVRLSYLVSSQVTGFDQVRSSASTISYNRREGVIIPAEAVFEKEGKQGVFLNRGGRVVFQEVGILDRQDENVMVEGLNPYSLVISRPELVEEGRRLN